MRLQADSAKKALGREGEATASEFLNKQGFRVLERNYRCRLGEVDLIAEKGGDLFFIEVKTRHDTDTVSPLELIPRAKQVHISKVAQHYYAAKRVGERQGRFALLIADYGKNPPQCELLLDIFDLAWGY